MENTLRNLESMQRLFDNRPAPEPDGRQTRFLVMVDGTEMKSCDSRAQAEAWAWFYNTSPGCRAKIMEVEWEEE